MKALIAAVMAGIATIIAGIPAGLLFALINGFTWPLFFNIVGGVFFTTFILFWLTIINE